MPSFQLSRALVLLLSLLLGCSWNCFAQLARLQVVDQPNQSSASKLLRSQEFHEDAESLGQDGSVSSLRAYEEDRAFGIGVAWERLVANAPWDARRGLGAVDFNGKLLVFGGETASSFRRDIWSSSNGIEWDLEATADWDPRANFATVVHNSRLYVIGGFSGTLLQHLNDVWRTEPAGGAENPDPYQFSVRRLHNTNPSAEGTFEPRSYATVLSFQAELILMGGCGGDVACSEPFDKVYHSSDDGLNWAVANVIGQWGSFVQMSSGLFTAVIHPNDNKRIILVGGTATGLLSMNDNVESYTFNELGSTGTVGRYFGSMHSFFDRIWLIGGIEGTQTTTNKVAFSDDFGATWTVQVQEVSFARRHSSGGVIYNNRICEIGGFDNGIHYNDLWCSIVPDLPGPWINVTSGQVTGTTAYYASPVVLKVAPDPLPAEVEWQIASTTDGLQPTRSSVLKGSTITIALPVDSTSLTYTIRSKVFFPEGSAVKDSETSSRPLVIKRRIPEPEVTLQVQIQHDADTAQVDILCNSHSGVQSSQVKVTFKVMQGEEEVHSCNACPSSSFFKVKEGSYDVTAGCTAPNWPPSRAVSRTVVVTREAPPPTPSPSPTPSPTPPVTTTPEPVITTTPKPPPKVIEVTSVTTCCDPRCRNFEECAPQTVGAWGLQLSGPNLDVVGSIEVGGRECEEVVCSIGHDTTGEAGCLCTGPTGLGTQPITIFGVEGQVLELTDGITYEPSPKIDRVRAKAGSTGGGTFATVIGKGLGAVLAGQSTETPGPWKAFEYEVNVGHTSAASIEWLSDSSLKVKTPQGVGIVDVSVIVHGQTAIPADPVNSKFSYEAPTVESISPSFGALSGGISVTITGSNFGHHSSLVSPTMKRRSCTESVWLADTSMRCVTPPGTERETVSAMVVVGGQAAQGGTFDYTASSPLINLQSPQTVASLTSPGPPSGQTRIDMFRDWMVGALALATKDQIQFTRIQQIAGKRRQSVFSELSMLIIDTVDGPNRHIEHLSNFKFLAESQNAFSGSPLAITRVSVEGGGWELSFVEPEESSTPPPNDPVVMQARQDLIVILAIVCVVCAVLLAAAISFRTLRRRYPREWDDFWRRQANLWDRLKSRSQLHAEIVSLSPLSSPANAVPPNRAGTDVCDQCHRSGFTFCVHRNLVHGSIHAPIGVEGAPTAPSMMDLEIDESCVVCLENPRNAVVIHDDPAKSRHRVMCLGCALSVYRDSGLCPVCRVAIFTVVEANALDGTSLADSDGSE